MDKLINLIKTLQPKTWLIIGIIGVIVIAGVAYWSYSSVPYNTKDPEVQKQLEIINNLRKDIKDGKNFVGSYIEIGHIYEELGDTQRALATYQKLARLRPQSSPPFIALGQYYKDHNQPELAEKYILKALNNDPSNVSIYEDLTMLYTYALTGREQKFEALILDAVNKTPSIKPNLYQILAFYYKNTGNIDKAKSYLEQLITLAPERTSDWRQAIAELGSNK